MSPINVRSLCLSLTLVLHSKVVASTLSPEHEAAFETERSRFWRHHVRGKSLLVNGVDHYDNLHQCLHSKLTDEDRTEMKKPNYNRSVKHRFMDKYGDGPVFLVEIVNAMSPVKVKAVQSLAACVRQYIPHMYESRAMYIEMGLDGDPGLGGNCPTHVAPIVSIFLPEVVEEMLDTVKLAYEAGGWNSLVVRDELLKTPWNEAYPSLDNIGMRASEHLTYSDFPKLDFHDDGATAYTLNFAFSGPDDYKGGYFAIRDHTTGREHRVKPDKYGALVFLGGDYKHAVTEITSGHREMFSTEWWGYPDMPFGNSLWNAVPSHMARYMKFCEWEEQKRIAAGEEDDGTRGCQIPFPQYTGDGKPISEIERTYNSSGTKPADGIEEKKCSAEMDEGESGACSAVQL